MNEKFKNTRETIERITNCVIKLPDGRLIFGPLGPGHVAIENRIMYSLKDDPVTLESVLSSLTRGFETNLRPFISREEAAKIAFRAGQTPFAKPKLFSEDL